MSIFKREKKITDTMIAYRSLFDSEDGKKVLYDLIKTCHVLTSTFDGDPNEMMYREGERSVVLRILKTINTDPQQIMKLMEEGNQMEEKYVD